MTLAFEPEVNNVASSPERARQLIDEVGSPAVKVVMDPANIFKAGQLPQMQDKLREAFGLLGQDVALAHAKDLDHDGEACHLGAGQGLLDYPLYLSLLQQSGFDGTVVLHQMHHLSDAEIDSSFRLRGPQRARWLPELTPFVTLRTATRPAVTLSLSEK